MFVFAFLFGISMDYQVFLTERIRELRQGGARNGDAVRGGLRGTGRMIVTAALIMVVAFGGFAMGSDIGMKEFGFGLAAAVAIHALLIRCLIVPALLAMAGERTWRRRREAVPDDTAMRVLRPRHLASALVLGPVGSPCSSWGGPRVGLIVTLVGILVLLGLAHAARGAGDLERRLAAGLLDVRVPRPPTHLAGLDPYQPARLGHRPGRVREQLSCCCGSPSASRSPRS